MYLKLLIVEGRFFKESDLSAILEEGGAEDFGIEHCLVFAGVVVYDQLVVAEDETVLTETHCLQIQELLLPLLHPLPLLPLAHTQESRAQGRGIVKESKCCDQALAVNGNQQ